LALPTFEQLWRGTRIKPKLFISEVRQRLARMVLFPKTDGVAPKDSQEEIRLEVILRNSCHFQ